MNAQRMRWAGRAAQRRARERRPVGGRTRHPGAGDRGDDPGAGLDAPDDVVAGVAKVQVAIGAELQAVGLAE